MKHPLRQKLSDLTRQIASQEAVGTGIIRWGSPVPFFGDPTTATFATLGINPSNREFVDPNGTELSGKHRRFHTLRSLEIADWSETGPDHVKEIYDACENYFRRNPYDNWFKSLDRVLSHSGYSYYGNAANACHLDLIPYATGVKWGALTTRQRNRLVALSNNTFAVTLRNSQIRYLILNGASVVRAFAAVSDMELQTTNMPDWTLPRKNHGGVEGVAFLGETDKVGDIPLGRHLKVLGFNHNIQSSFGVTRQVKESISQWIFENTNRGY